MGAAAAGSFATAAALAIGWLRFDCPACMHASQATHPTCCLPTPCLLPAHSCPLLLSSPCSPAATDFVVVVNGAVCRPCARLYTLLQESARPLLPPSVITAEYQGEGLAVLKRTENGA